ncbi:MAG: hypothetical protein H7A23_00090 [Leptospiraceae bacterium]|nr:hypothetical protein [Leptospiraceae bacterium]MCP5492929.1 hypothetical protein [Leptospiraceae bacterium]
MLSLFFALSCTTSRNDNHCSFDLPFLPICTYNLLTYEDCGTQGDGDIVSKNSCYNNKITICLLEFVVTEQCKTQARKKSSSSSSGYGSSSSGGSSGGSGGGGGGGGGGSGGGGG